MIDKTLYLLLGSVLGILIVLWIARIDLIISKNKEVGFKIRKSNFMNYLIATCWEVLGIILGIFIGRYAI